MRIKAMGDVVTTWVNGQEMITITDAKIGAAKGKLRYKSMMAVGLKFDGGIFELESCSK